MYTGQPWESCSHAAVCSVQQAPSDTKANTLLRNCPAYVTAKYKKSQHVDFIMASAYLGP